MKSKGIMTTGLQTYYDIALDAKLPNPLGRAIYAWNQHINGRDWNRTEFTILEPIDHMRRARPETAKRWLKHWREGGSLKHLCYSREQWSQELKRRRQR